MERNDASSGASTPGSAGHANAGGSIGEGQGARAGDASESTSETGGFTDRAREIGGVARDRLADVGSATRERAGHMRDSLADALSSSADKLRQRSGGPSGQLGAATGHGEVALEHDGRMAGAASRVAGGMDATADWLREADLEGLKAGIENQVKEHPGRTLLIAVGLGYLLGKALRK